MDQSEILLSAQRALLDKITPNLRKVNITIEDGVFILNFFYDKPLSDDEQELASLADTEFIADFPSPECKTDCRIVVLPYPIKISSQLKESTCVYARYEADFSNSE